MEYQETKFRNKYISELYRKYCRVYPEIEDA